MRFPRFSVSKAREGEGRMGSIRKGGEGGRIEEERREWDKGRVREKKLKIWHGAWHCGKQLLVPSELGEGWEG